MSCYNYKKIYHHLAPLSIFFLTGTLIFFIISPYLVTVCDDNGDISLTTSMLLSVLKDLAD